MYHAYLTPYEKYKYLYNYDGGKLFSAEEGYEAYFVLGTLVKDDGTVKTVRLPRFDKIVFKSELSGEKEETIIKMYDRLHPNFKKTKKRQASSKSKTIKKPKNKTNKKSKSKSKTIQKPKNKTNKKSKTKI